MSCALAGAFSKRKAKDKDVRVKRDRLNNRVMRAFRFQKSGARATADNPQRNTANIHASKVLAREGAAENSCQMKTPQAAEIMVAPCPME